jgi:hypothetical protein
MMLAMGSAMNERGQWATVGLTAFKKTLAELPPHAFSPEKDSGAKSFGPDSAGASASRSYHPPRPML